MRYRDPHGRGRWLRSCDWPRSDRRTRAGTVFPICHRRPISAGRVARAAGPPGVAPNVGARDGAGNASGGSGVVGEVAFALVLVVRLERTALPPPTLTGDVLLSDCRPTLAVVIGVVVAFPLYGARASLRRAPCGALIACSVCWLPTLGSLDARSRPTLTPASFFPGGGALVLGSWEEGPWEPLPSPTYILLLPQRITSPP